MLETVRSNRDSAEEDSGAASTVLYAAVGAVATIHSEYTEGTAYSTVTEAITIEGFTFDSHMITPFPSAQPRAIDAAEYPALARVWANDADAVFDTL
jgi:hypothetical protein